MQNSDFGGMENVGNTTITTNRIMPFPQITDPAFEYMIRVKVHEYYHNQNGSEVTGRSPFEIWLNEAVTCTWKSSTMLSFRRGHQRLQRVLDLLAPASGTFALDSGVLPCPSSLTGSMTLTTLSLQLRM
jgi:aminopeptidase N